MSILITSGCSYTNYKWNTWADYLGKSFDEFINLGFTGSGPRYSFITVCDYLNFTPNIDYSNTTVIIQWSSLLRKDYRVKEQNNKWSGGGQVNNNSFYDNKYLDSKFNILDTASDLFYYIEHLLLLSNTLGFKLLMFYMFEPWEGKMFGEPTKPFMFENQHNDFVNSPYYTKLKYHSKQSYWINPSLEKFSLLNELRKPEDDDTHPTTEQHLLYADMIKQLYL